MIVIDPEVVGNLVDEGLCDLPPQVMGRKPQREVRLAEQVDDVGQPPA